MTKQKKISAYQRCYILGRVSGEQRQESYKLIIVEKITKGSQLIWVVGESPSKWHEITSQESGW